MCVCAEVYRVLFGNNSAFMNEVLVTGCIIDTLLRSETDIRVLKSVLCEPSAPCTQNVARCVQGRSRDGRGRHEERYRAVSSYTAASVAGSQDLGDVGRRWRW